MFNSPILDLVILLSFTYFVGSLMLTSINESISAGLKIRATDLKNTIENLLFDDDWKKFVNDKIFPSQHIKSLMNNKEQFPSYIPAQNFVLTLIEQIKAGNYNKQNILQGIEDSPIPAAMKKVLNDLWAKAQSNISAIQSDMASFEKEIENFYNNAMERASGWYKRKIRRILLIMGFILAAVLNIDTIKITNDSLNDKNKLSQTVDKIVEAMPDLKEATSINVTVNDSSVEKINQSIRIDSLIKGTSNKIKDLKIQYNNIGGYQLGYGKGGYFKDWWVGDAEYPLLSLFLKLLGLVITAFALQLGSNYWFELLSKAVNLRATGKKPNGKK